MTDKEFELYASRTRLHDRSRRMAYAVLVEGVSQAEAARREGVGRETARRAVARVLREYRRALGVPPGWETLTVSVPPEAAEEIRAIERREQERAGLRVCFTQSNRVTVAEQ